MPDTTDAADRRSEPVFRLMYRSHSLIAEEQRRPELGAIFNAARTNNKSLGVTGALMISDDAFVQVLEGDETVVRDLLGRIAHDPRHDDVSVLAESTVEGRTFGRWAMARVGTDDGPDIRLLSNANSAVIVAAPGRDQSVTSEQETVLAVMRKALAKDTLST